MFVLVTDKSYTEIENKELRGNKQQKHGSNQLHAMTHTTASVNLSVYYTNFTFKKQW